jgi:fumarylacetoacetase
MNDLMASGGASALRKAVSNLLATGNVRGQKALAPHLVPMREVAMSLPCGIGNYSDFYASVFHATNVGRLFRPDKPLLPNYKWMPVAYHGRASSIVVSGSDVVRPRGQTKAPSCEAPVFEPCRNLDYEVELGAVVGQSSRLGEPVPIARAASHVFGFCLLNDWSARDIQAWEGQPLGPFLSKNFASTISPWVVTLDALAPFRTRAFVRPTGDPEPLAYLRSTEDQESGGLDIQIDTLLMTEKMRAAKMQPVRISRASSANLYWTVAQMVAHHTSNGCNLATGDLIGTGTVSGADRNSWGSLLEIGKRGSEPIQLPNGETRAFLEDGDEVILRAECRHEDFARIGFGECRGRVISALA